MNARMVVLSVGLVTLASGLFYAWLSRPAQPHPVAPSPHASPALLQERSQASTDAALPKPAALSQALGASIPRRHGKMPDTGDGVVEGVVLSASDVAAPGAKVKLLKPSIEGFSYGFATSLEVVKTAESDEAGRFKFSGVSPLCMSVSAELNGTAATALLFSLAGKGAETVTLKLAPAGSIEGRVLDPDGAPVAGAKITPLATTPDPAQSKPVLAIGYMSAETATDGTFSCAGLAMGYWMFAVEAPGFLIEKTAPEYAVGEDAEIRLKSCGAIVTGTVVEAATGRPVPGLVLTAAPDVLSDVLTDPSTDALSDMYAANPSKATTGPDGTFRITGLASGPYIVGTADAVVPEFDETKRVESPWSLSAPPAKIVVRDGSETSVGTLQVEPSGVISGRVVWAGTDDPVSGAEVNANLESYERAFTSKPTGPDGTYRLGGLPSGNLTVNASNIEEIAFGDERIVQIKAGAELVGIDLTIDRPLSATGTVLDANRQPVAGAVVKAEGQFGRLEDVKSGADGTFVIEHLEGVTRPTLSAFKDGMTSESVLVSPESNKDLVLVLRKGATISGTLVDENNRPVANAIVLASAKEGSDENSRQGKATDASGTFTVTGLPAGTYGLHAEVRSPDTRFPDAEALREQFTAMQQEVERQLGASLSPEMLKTAEEELNETTSQFAAMESDYPIVPWGEPLHTVELAWGQNVAGLRLVMKPDTLEDEDMEAQEAGFVKGRVVNSSGSPVAGAELSWYMDDGFDLGTGDTTNAQGEFELSALDSEACTLKAFHPRHGRGFATARAGQDDVRIMLKPFGAIRGKVLDAKGQPITGCKVGFKEGAHVGDGLWDTELPMVQAGAPEPPEDTPPESVTADEADVWVPDMTVSNAPPEVFAEIHDPRGEFELKEVPPGKVTVFATAKGYSSGWTVVDVPSGKAAENVVLKLEDGAGIKGLVVDTAGQPVAGATIASERGPGEMSALFSMSFENEGLATSDDQGRFTIDTVTPAITRLWALHPNFAPGVAAFAKGQSDVKIVLSSGGAVEGVVTLEGKPISYAEVRIYTMTGQEDLAGPMVAEGQTGPDGRFLLHHVPEGTFTLMAYYFAEEFDELSTQEIEVTVENGKTSTVEVALEKAAVNTQTEVEPPAPETEANP